MSAFPITTNSYRCTWDKALLEAIGDYFWLCSSCEAVYAPMNNATALVTFPPGSSKISGYYGFPGFNIPDPDETPAKPKPTTCLEVLKQHEENVEKALDKMPQIEKLIIYSVLNRQGVRMDSIDREIYKEAQAELKKAHP